jgi:hypothetical protein
VEIQAVIRQHKVRWLPSAQTIGDLPEYRRRDSMRFVSMLVDEPMPRGADVLRQVDREHVL